MSESISVRDSLQAAMSAGGSDEAQEVAIEPVAAPETPAEPIQAEAATNENNEADKVPGARDRDESGRFAPKAEAQTPEAETNTAQPAEPEPQTEAIRIPPSLPAAVKAQWSELKPEVQNAFSKLEDSVQTAKAEWGKKGERLNRFDEILGPHREKWAIAGLDEFAGVQTLLAAQSILERNPVDGILQIARSYGYSPQQLVQHVGQMIGQPAPQGAPYAQAQEAPDFNAALSQHLAPVLQRFQTLEQQWTQQTQSAEAAQLASAQAEIADFASKPENRYFENVKNEVAAFLQTGQAQTLSEAYDRAVWANPEIRALLQKQSSVDAAKKATEEAARTKSAQARAASGSVTGAPAPGAQAPRAGSSGNLRSDLLNAAQEHGAQV